MQVVGCRVWGAGFGTSDGMAAVLAVEEAGLDPCIREARKQGLAQVLSGRLFVDTLTHTHTRTHSHSHTLTHAHTQTLTRGQGLPQVLGGCLHLFKIELATL